jgi:hypothetical protein
MNSTRPNRKLGTMFPAGKDRDRRLEGVSTPGPSGPPRALANGCRHISVVLADGRGGTSFPGKHLNNIKPYLLNNFWQMGRFTDARYNDREDL